MLPLIIVVVAFGCEDDMADQPRYEPFEASALFANGMASRPIPEHTVARGHLRSDEHLFRGKVNGQSAMTFPFPMSKDWLQRGRQRYDIFCAVCHGATGAGDGMIVQRGLTQPPAFYPLAAHEQQFPTLYAREQYLLTAPVGHYYDVITNGWGAMFSYNDRIRPEDRWAIIMYVKALQLSQTATLKDLPPDKQKELEATVP